MEFSPRYLLNLSLWLSSLLKKGAPARDPALRGSCKCSHNIGQYAARSKSPRALADGLVLVFQQPAVK
jgi:hypothetical protein